MADDLPRHPPAPEVAVPPDDPTPASSRLRARAQDLSVAVLQVVLLQRRSVARGGQEDQRLAERVLAILDDAVAAIRAVTPPSPAASIPHALQEGVPAR